MDLADALSLGDAELVAFVGAGGKKTAMGRLVAEGQERGRSVGYTTTTHAPPPGSIPLVLAAAEQVPLVATGDGDAVALARERVPDPERVDEKVRGYDPDAVDGLFESGRFDWLLVKADGARLREFKAPGPGEPAIPRASTHVVPVASVGAVGEPLDADTVHRVDRVASITGLSAGASLDAAAVGAVLASPQGGCKCVPGAATVTPLVNKADTPELRETAREVLGVAFERSSRLSRGLVTSLAQGYVEVVETA